MTPSAGAVVNETAQLAAVGEATAAAPATVTAQLLTTETDTTDLTAVPSTGALVYDDLAGQNADVRFTVTSTRVKKDILLTAAPIQAVSYTTEMTLSDGLAPTLHEDGTVFIRDAEENEVFRIVAPYMTDAADELSWEVAVELEQNADVWRLTVTPDLAWLRDEARVHPVTIDPTVTTSANNNAANVWDT